MKKTISRQFIKMWSMNHTKSTVFLCLNTLYKYICRLQNDTESKEQLFNIKKMKNQENEIRKCNEEEDEAVFYF